MLHDQNTKTMSIIAPAALSSSATTTGRIDCLGFDGCQVDVILAAAAAASSGVDCIYIKEADVTTTSSFATFSGCVEGTDYTTGAGSTTAGVLYRFHFDLRARKRYLLVGIELETPTNYGCVMGTLTRPEIGVSTATLAGVNNTRLVC
jgi:hypothetical protein